MRLKDQVAIITGGGGGMGTGISTCLAKQGAHIVVADVNLEGAQRTVAAVEALGQRGLAVVTDITKQEECDRLVSQALERFGQIDILVNNAGIFGERLGLPFTNQTEAEWDENYAVNLKGPFFLCKSVAHHMMERKHGKIINISSIAAKRDPPFLPSYAATKNALLTLTRVVAKDLGPYNINVNAICPGFVWTAFWHELAPMLANTDPAYEGLEARQVFDRFVQGNIPLKREQTPEDVGNLVVFLSSEEARNITGQTINVDGGVAMG
jgi:meso-butanediol dehydrogenase/(S,S)-butanediol dehydrogenase/diacetyl reductase